MNGAVTLLVTYQWLDESAGDGPETMAVFDVATEAEAIREAHYSLKWGGEGYEILAVVRNSTEGVTPI